MTERRWDDEQQKRMLAALIARLEACSPFHDYPLDPVEREVILEALRAFGEQARQEKKS